MALPLSHAASFGGLDLHPYLMGLRAPTCACPVPRNHRCPCGWASPANLMRVEGLIGRGTPKLTVPLSGHRQALDQITLCC